MAQRVTMSLEQPLANQLTQAYAWNLTASNIALGNGSQANFFILFNLFAGKMADGSHKKVLFSTCARIRRLCRPRFN